MKCFEILGIEPTRDANQIRAAYAALLPSFSPEKDPEGFQRLREAYTEAGQYAAEGEEKKELSPEEQFFEDLATCYNNYARRIDIQEWKSLLEQDICFAIDMSEEINEGTLRFIMSNYYYPVEVWKLFDEHFHWSENRNRLIEKFPENFIDYVINRIQDESKIYYEDLISAKDGRQDEFLKIFSSIIQRIREGYYYDAEQDLNILKDICPEHPDIYMVEATFAIEIGNFPKAIEKINQAIALKPEDMDYYAYRGDIYLRVGEAKLAYDDYKKSLSFYPAAYNMMFSLIKCCLTMEKYEWAEEYADILDENVYYNPVVSVASRQIYEFRHEEVEKLYQENPEDINLQLSMAKLLFFVDKKDKAYEIYQKVLEAEGFTIKDAYYYTLLLCHMNKLDELLQACNQFLERYPDHKEYTSKLWSLKGWSLGEMDRSEEAIACYDQTLAMNPEEAATMSNKSYELNKLGRYDEAIRMAEQAIDLKPSSARAYKNKAKALLELGMYQEAIHMANRSLDIYPFQEEPYETKMQVFLRVQYYDDALEVYQAAESYDVHSHKLYAYKGDALWCQGKLTEALDWYDKAIAEKPEEYGYYTDKGCILYDMEKYQEAIVQYEKSLEIKEEQGRAHYYQVLSYWRSGKSDMAKDLIHTYLTRYNEHSERFYGVLADIYRMEENLQAAIANYEKALEILPDYSSFLYSLGRCWQQEGQFDKAIEIYFKTIELDECDAVIYSQLTFCLYEVGKYEECVEWCNKGLEFDAREIFLYDNKADALHRLKRFKEALEVCEEGLAIQPTEQDLILTKAKIFRLQGRMKEALILLEQVIQIDSSSRIGKQASEYKRLVQNEIEKETPKESGFLKKLFKR